MLLLRSYVVRTFPAHLFGSEYGWNVAANVFVRLFRIAVTTLVSYENNLFRMSCCMMFSEHIFCIHF